MAARSSAGRPGPAAHMASSVLNVARPAARAAARAGCEAAESRQEDARQAAERAKTVETTAIAKAGEDHREHFDGALSARKELLDEMRSVRDKVHGQLRAQRKQGRQQVDTSSRDLACAGKRNCDAEAEAELWRNNAAEAEAHRRATWERNEASFRRHKMGQDTRVAEADTLASARENHGHRLAEEASDAFDSFYHLHHTHCATQEQHAKNAYSLRDQSCFLAERNCLAQVDWAKKQAGRSHALSAREVREAHEDSSVKVASARQELADRHRQCQDTLAQERVCAGQARKIAVQQKEAQEVDQRVLHGKLEARMQQTVSHLSKKDVLPEERAQTAACRNEAWEERNKKRMDAAQARADKEDVMSAERVDRAKVALSNLQAVCAARINSLLERWEEAKLKDAAKVQAAQEKTDGHLRYCEEQRKRHEDHKANVLQRTQQLSDTKATVLQEKVAALAEISDQRVAMMQRQSQERRRMAETQLAELQRHIEDVRARCAERVKTEEETAQEKIRLSRERHAAASARAAQRAREAEASRDEARVAYDAVMARCHGAAAEARRRGLMNVANILEPPAPPPPPPPPVRVAQEAFDGGGMEDFADDKGGPGHATGSTAFPPPSAGSGGGETVGALGDSGPLGPLAAAGPPEAVAAGGAGRDGEDGPGRDEAP